MIEELSVNSDGLSKYSSKGNRDKPFKISKQTFLNEVRLRVATTFSGNDVPPIH